MAFVIKYLTAVPRGSGNRPKWNLSGLAIYNIDIGFGIYRGFHLRSARLFLNYVSISVAKYVMLRYTVYMYIQGVRRNAIYFSYFPTICNNVTFFCFEPYFNDIQRTTNDDKISVHIICNNIWLSSVQVFPELS